MLLCGVAELERHTIRERINAGIRHARRFGIRSGRPIGRPRVSIPVKKLISAYKELGSVKAAARKIGCNSGTAWFRLRDAGVLKGKVEQSREQG